MKIEININNLVRENVKGLSPYSSARDEYVSDGSQMVFLDANENPFENGVNRYPDPQQRSLKAVLAANKGVSSSQILLGNGSDEVLDLIFRAFCEPKEDNVISLPPTYGMYKVLSNINNIENREVLLTEDFQPNLAEILKVKDEHSKLLFICSPNNPTGNGISSAIIRELLNRFHGLVVIDEAYIDFSSDVSWITELSNYPNLIVTQTLSKAYDINELTQQRALERIEDLERVNKEVLAILKERDALYNVLGSIDFVEKIYPSDANFILTKVDDATKRYHQLLKAGIVVRNRTTQPLCENTLRFTVGTAKENKKLIKLLKKIDNQ